MVDVEFIAQVLVLKWGKSQKQLRLTSTRQVLQEMVRMQLLAEPQGRFLTRDIRFIPESGKGPALGQRAGSQYLAGRPRPGAFGAQFGS